MENDHPTLGDFLRTACRRKGISLSQASRDMGKSRNWLERIINGGIKRPRVESCYLVAAYFNEDPNKILQLAGYIAASSSPPSTVDEIYSIAQLLPPDDQESLLEYALLLKLKMTVGTKVEFPDVGIDWATLKPRLARKLAAFIRDHPQTVDIWIEALNVLPERAVEFLLMNAQRYREQLGISFFERGQGIVRRLAEVL